MNLDDWTDSTMSLRPRNIAICSAIAVLFAALAAVEIGRDTGLVTEAHWYSWGFRIVIVLAVLLVVGLFEQWYHERETGESGLTGGFPVKRKDTDEEK